VGTILRRDFSASAPTCQYAGWTIEGILGNNARVKISAVPQLTSQHFHAGQNSSPDACMTKPDRNQNPATEQPAGPVDEPSAIADRDQNAPDTTAPTEYGGPSGKEPTRYGDWEKNGRCIDF